MANVTILNFHGVGEPARTLEPGEAPYWVSIDQYRETLEMASSGEFVAKDQIVITFDDGNASDIAHGAPELERLGLTGAFFPLSSRLDTPGSLSSADLADLVARGHTVGTHGADHVDWRRLSGAAVERELDQARSLLSEAAGAPIDAAAVPFGNYDRKTLARLKQRDFRVVYTSDGGGADRSSWLQARTSIRGDMGRADIAAILKGDAPPLRRARRVLAKLKKRMV